MKIYSGVGAASIKAWVDGVEIEQEALEQLKNVARLPFIFQHVAVMPDAHWGIGASVGSVIATKGAIVPAAVGVDIGCGMVAARTPLTASDLPTSLKSLRDDVEWGIPTGFNDHRSDRAPAGEWEREVPGRMLVEDSSGADGWAWVRPLPSLADGLSAIFKSHPQVRTRRDPLCQLGTLGGGNHFVEVCLDEEQRVWVMLHSGSRGIGNSIGRYFIERAKEFIAGLGGGGGPVQLPHPDLAWLPEGTRMFSDYVEAVGWAQRYARVNRSVMMRAAIAALQKHTRPFNSIPLDSTGEYVGDAQRGSVVDLVVNCHHNYVSEEEHFGERVLVTRKGAVSARDGELGIIPGSMGARSYIVRGKGNPESFHSCSHGAGRRMSRGKAKRTFTLEDHAAATAGVECRKDAGVLDETPGAYKDIDAVMAAQADLVDVVHTLKAVLCVKG